MKIQDIKSGLKCYSTAINDTITVIEVAEVLNDNDALITVLYKSNLYLNTNHQLKAL